VLGLTFKEDVADVRNTKVDDILRELDEYGVNVLVHDPVANVEEVKHVFDIDLVNENELMDVDCVVFAVPHKEYKDKYDLDALHAMFKEANKGVLVDIKSIFNQKDWEAKSITYWSL